MKTASLRKAMAIVLVGSLLVALGGCQCTFGKLDGKCHGDNNDGDDGKRIRLHPIYEAVLVGALVGLIVGHQSDEDCNGTAIGAGIGGIGAILAAIDRQGEYYKNLPREDELASIYGL
jgi:hypothetical protein